MSGVSAPEEKEEREGTYWTGRPKYNGNEPGAPHRRRDGSTDPRVLSEYETTSASVETWTYMIKFGCTPDPVHA